MDNSTMDRNFKNDKDQIQSYFIINDYFQDKGKTKNTIIEEYIIREAFSLL